MKRVLSSSMTDFWRYVFPAFWLGGFGFGIIGLFVGAFHGPKGEPAPEFMYWLFPCLWLFSAIWLLSFSWQLCDVALNNHAILEISRLGCAYERIPLSEITRVSQSHMSNPPTITLHLEVSGNHRRRIVFLAPGKRRYLSDHPLAGELRSLIHHARMGSYVSTTK